MDLRHVIESRARVEGELIMVDEFLNHRVDPEVIRDVGKRLAEIIAPWDVDLILTAEASGIPPALACSLASGFPLIYAKKYVGPGNRYTLAREVSSPTKGTEYRVEVSRRVLDPGSRIVVIDDFLAGGRTAEALGEIIIEAGCRPAGFLFVIEKSFTDGRRRLEAHGWQVTSLVTIRGVAGGQIVFEDD